MVVQLYLFKALHYFDIVSKFLHHLYLPSWAPSPVRQVCSSTRSNLPSALFFDGAMPMPVDINGACFSFAFLLFPLFSYEISTSSSLSLECVATTRSFAPNSELYSFHLSIPLCSPSLLPLEDYAPVDVILGSRPAS